MFTQMMIDAEDMGLDLEVVMKRNRSGYTNGYTLTASDGTVTYCNTLHEVAEALGRVRNELLDYAEEWDRNTAKIRPA